MFVPDKPCLIVKHYPQGHSTGLSLKHEERQKRFSRANNLAYFRPRSVKSKKSLIALPLVRKLVPIDRRSNYLTICSFGQVGFDEIVSRSKCLQRQRGLDGATTFGVTTLGITTLPFVNPFRIEILKTQLSILRAASGKKICCCIRLDYDS